MQNIILALTLLFLFSCSDPATVDPPPTGVDSLQLFRDAFAEPQECQSCHPNHFKEWSESMHAYAMVDPIFLELQKVGQQRSNNQLDQFCVKCHTPFGVLLNETPPGFQFDDLSDLAKSAVNCDVCHVVKIQTFSRGEGLKEFHLDRVRRASLENPVANSFHQSKHDNRYSFSNFCSTCHDVKSPDKSFFLETTNIEWDNSPYIAMGLECQDCHMPAYNAPAAVGGPERISHRHQFVGVDYPLTDFPGKENTIAMVDSMLKIAAELTVETSSLVIADSQFTLIATINNHQTGHDLPSGTIFERQMWLEVQVKNSATGEVLLSSGMLDSNKDLMNFHSEDVSNGTVPEDTLLTLFNGKPIDENQQETLFFWEAKSVEKHTIAAFQEYDADYSFTVPANVTELDISVRLLFRSFPPYLFRAINKADLVDELIVFEMASTQITINN